MSMLEGDKILKLPRPPIWIDTTDGIQEIQSAFLPTKEHYTIAVDSEWCTDKDDDTAISVATLQISVVEEDSIQTWIVDLLKDDPQYQLSAKNLVQTIFGGISSDRFSILGFAFAHDLPKLQEFVGSTKPLSHGFLDVQLLGTATPNQGLQACAAEFSSTPLSKEHQCSDWSQRPLSTAQLDYAGLDAGVLFVLLAEYQNKLLKL